MNDQERQDKLLEHAILQFRMRDLHKWLKLLAANDTLLGNRVHPAWQWPEW